MSGQAPGKLSVAVFYQAWGGRSDSLCLFETFKKSYVQWQAGLHHDLFIIYQDFKNSLDLRRARNVFCDVPHYGIYRDNTGMDIGAYFSAASQVDHDTVCFLNAYSKILGPQWLLKLAINLMQPDVGMVGCSGSLEAPQHPGRQNVCFPNPHLRTTGFMMRRRDFLALQAESPLIDKMDTYMLEHGPDSFTRRIASQGLKTLVVGKNGRGYEWASWVTSQTFRQGTQPNLLIGDNRTKDYEKAPIDEKRKLFSLAWGNAETWDIVEPGHLL